VDESRHLAKRTLCQTEVEEKDLALLSEFKVRRFEYHDAEPVVVARVSTPTLSAIIGPAQHLRWLNGSPAIPTILQVVTRNELHYEKISITLAEVVHHLGKAWCFKLASKDASRANADRAFIFLASEGFFQRDDAANTLINRFVDCTHPAFAKFASHTIPV